MNKFMHKLRDAINRIEAANRICPLKVELNERRLLRLVELVADAEMPVDQIVHLILRLNAGETLFTMVGH